jgi:DNA-binding transcriptional LysR family regulator
MPEIHFSALDLNLLRVFDALAEEGSVTRAGVRLNLTQSAVSHALGRLRHVLGDELFVRGPDGMRPTARALEIAPRLRLGLDQLQHALTPAAFVAAETSRRFTIATSAYIGATLMPAVIDLIRREAPGAEVRLRAVTETIGEDLQNGRVDIAIGGFGAPGQRFAKEPLFQENIVWALRADHPAAGARTLTLKALADLPHIILASADEDRAVEGRVSEGGLERLVIWDDAGTLDQALAEHGLQRTIGLTTQDTISALAIASKTDMIALAPGRLARAFAEKMRLKLFEPPYVSPPAVIEALWRQDLSHSPPIEWLRGRLRAAAAQL